MTDPSHSDFSHINPYTKKAGAPKGVSYQQREIYAQEKKAEVWKLYKNGRTSYRMIENETGVPKTTIGRWIRAELKELAAQRKDLAENFLEAELQRLDYILELLMKDVTHSIEIDFYYEDGKPRKDIHMVDRVDPKIVAQILKVQERRSKYLALDKPVEVKVEHEFDLAELIDAAMLMKDGKKPKAIEAEFEEKDNDEKV